MSDFGEAKRRVSRKLRQCEACTWPIDIGEPHWHYAGIYSGEWNNWRMHQECWDLYNEDGDGEFIPGEFPPPLRVTEAWER